MRAREHVYSHSQFLFLATKHQRVPGENSRGAVPAPKALSPLVVCANRTPKEPPAVLVSFPAPINLLPCTNKPLPDGKLLQEQWDWAQPAVLPPHKDHRSPCTPLCSQLGAPGLQLNHGCLNHTLGRCLFRVGSLFRDGC